MAYQLQTLEPVEPDAARKAAQQANRKAVQPQPFQELVAQLVGLGELEQLDANFDSVGRRESAAAAVA